MPPLDSGDETLDEVSPAILRPVGGSRPFLRNCCLVADQKVIIATDCKGRSTRFLLDGSDRAPTQMVDIVYGGDFVVVDKQGRGLICGSGTPWDFDEREQFCKAAGLEIVSRWSEESPPLRPDVVRLEEAAWLRGFAIAGPYITGASIVLAPIGRARDLPLWLMSPFLLWMLGYLIMKAVGYLPPGRVGPFQKRIEKELAEDAAQEKVETARTRRRRSS